MKTRPKTEANIATSIRRTNNIIENNLKARDFEGVEKELNGIDTGFDHVREMEQSLSGLLKTAYILEGVEGPEAVAAYENAVIAIHRILEAGITYAP